MSQKWMNFWNYVVLPVSMLAALYEISNGLYLSVIDLVAVGFLIYGLHQRLGWAYYLNWVVIGFKYIFAAMPSQYDLAQHQDIIPYMVIGKLLVFAVLFIVPNYFYWTKRKHLFVN